MIAQNHVVCLNGELKDQTKRDTKSQRNGSPRAQAVLWLTASWKEPFSRLLRHKVSPAINTQTKRPTNFPGATRLARGYDPPGDLRIESRTFAVRWKFRVFSARDASSVREMSRTLAPQLITDPRAIVPLARSSREYLSYVSSGAPLAHTSRFSSRT